MSRSVIMAVLVLAVSVSSIVYADAESDAFEVLQQWTRAFTESNVDGIVDLYADDALFYGTGSKTVVTDKRGIRAYFENALLNNRPRTAIINSYSALETSDNTVIFFGLDTITGVRDGTQFNSYGRVTIVVANRDGKWKIVQFHRSAIPD